MFRAGKEVMLKYVVQTIPTYIMSCFQLPDNICGRMKMMISNHWWGFEGGKRKMHSKSWECLTTPKFMGGMRFRDMKIFNQAMLARRCWILLTQPESLCARVLKGRYFPKCSFLDASTTRSCSFTWRSLMYGKNLLLQGIVWCIGDGNSVRINSDRWVLDAPCHQIRPKVYIPDELKVSALIDNNIIQWNQELVSSCFSPSDGDKILSMPLSFCLVSDRVAWPLTKTGTLTIKSSYVMEKYKEAHLKISKQGRGEFSNQIQTTKE
jgi:hypothetical protein